MKVGPSNLVVRFSLDLSGFKHLLLLELSLHVGEQSVRADLNVRDLNGLKPHAPACQGLLEIVFENFTKGRSVLQNVIDGHVGDLVTDDGSSKVANFLGNHGRALPLQVVSEALEEFSGSVTKLVRRPNEHARNSHTLHLQCNLFG